MRWTRNNLRWLSRLALVALAFQLVTATVHLRTGHAAAGLVQSAPADHDHTGAADECAICAVLHLAGTTIVPDAVVARLPDAVSWRWNIASFDDLAIPAVASFQARGPPLT